MTKYGKPGVRAEYLGLIENSGGAGWDGRRDSDGFGCGIVKEAGSDLLLLRDWKREKNLRGEADDDEGMVMFYFGFI